MVACRSYKCYLALRGHALSGILLLGSRGSARQHRELRSSRGHVESGPRHGGMVFPNSLVQLKWPLIPKEIHAVNHLRRRESCPHSFSVTSLRAVWDGSYSSLFFFFSLCREFSLGHFVSIRGVDLGRAWVCNSVLAVGLYLMTWFDLAVILEMCGSRWTRDLCSCVEVPARHRACSWLPTWWVGCQLAGAPSRAR